MKNSEQLNITDLIHLKWAIKIKLHLYGDESIVDNDLYQKLSFLYEEEKTRFQLEKPAISKEAKIYLDESEATYKQQYEALLEREKVINDLIKINNTSFEEWENNGKKFQ